LLIADCRLHIDKRGKLLDYVNRLLAAFDRITAIAAPPSNINPMGALRSQKSKINNLVEPLTERELEILRLLPTELSTRELAEHFVVSINTIKTQLKSIYTKLDAHSREEAVEKAKAWNLLA
jgi:ATP/maltotriose-dependent transcriptional regulator MalT